VLKVVLPHRESEHEADALDVWDGEGAVGLLERDQARHALLVERCEPGTPLSKARREDPLQVVADLLPRLWKPATTPFRSLSTEAAWWTSYLERRWEEFSRPFERRLLDAALEFLTELPATQGQQVLVHQDLHGDNVLAAAREPWLVIDPKPLTGEREFALAPIVRSSELGHSPHAIRRRLDRLTNINKTTRQCPSIRKILALDQNDTIADFSNYVGCNRRTDWFRHQLNLTCRRIRDRPDYRKLTSQPPPPKVLL